MDMMALLRVCSASAHVTYPRQKQMKVKLKGRREKAAAEEEEVGAMEVNRDKERRGREGGRGGGRGGGGGGRGGRKLKHEAQQ